MNREEKLMELTEIAKHILGAVNGITYIPMSYVRRYNDLVKSVFGEEDPEIKEAERGNGN